MIAYRAALTVTLVIYLAAIVLTGYFVLSPAFDVPLALIGWLLFAAPMVWALVRRRRFPAGALIGGLFRPWPLALTFAALLLFSSWLAVTWQVPAQCNGVSLSCLKGYEWAEVDGAFSHALGGGVSEQISRAEYIREVGVHLRSAAAFGLWSLLFAWLASTALGPEPE